MAWKGEEMFAAPEEEVSPMAHLIMSTSLKNRIARTMKAAGDPSPSELESFAEKMEGLAILVTERMAADDEEEVDEELVAERAKEIALEMRVYEKAEKVNLLFMVDSTGSMAGHIDAVKTQVRDIVSNLHSSHPELQMYVGFLAYRDHCDEKSGQRFEVLSFTQNLSSFESFVGSLRATGGGDTAEDIHGALQQAGRQNWSVGGAETRVLVHIGDAPCHGNRYHDGVNDDHPDGDPHGLQSAELLQRLRALKVHYTFGRINSSTDKMIRVFNEELGNDGYIKTYEMADLKVVTKTVTLTLRTSITKTAAAIRATDIVKPTGEFRHILTAPRVYRIVPALPDWSPIIGQIVRIYANRPVKEKNLKPGGFLGWSRVSPSDGTRMDDARLKTAGNPFAEGTQRLVRYGQMMLKERTVQALKEFKFSGEGVHTLDSYMKKMEAASTAAHLAREYNEKGRPSGCQPIEFLMSYALEVYEGKRGKRFYNLENLLPHGSRVVRFCNHVGYWDEDVFDETLARFSRWTYDATHGYLIVVGLKGVKTSSGFTLIDPILHCTDLERFGSGNLGSAGIDRCLKALRAYT